MQLAKWGKNDIRSCWGPWRSFRVITCSDSRFTVINHPTGMPVYFFENLLQRKFYSFPSQLVSLPYYSQYQTSCLFPSPPPDLNEIRIAIVLNPKPCALACVTREGYFSNFFMTAFQRFENCYHVSPQLNLLSSRLNIPSCFSLSLYALLANPFIIFVSLHPSYYCVQFWVLRVPTEA